MMVVVHRAQGFRFVIYTSDHEPAHVHVIGSGQAKINLLGPGGAARVEFSVGIKKSELRRLLVEVEERRATLLRAWEQIHG